ncbi:MAG: class I SAM-dependent methyltransferase [Alphaproteobacteria bacterium]|nr:class I SAM-dependent methyltransferase [Alphaproteobacteria bacterium]
MIRVRWNQRFRYTHSTHKIFGRTVGEISGLLLHFKFTPQFHEHVCEEVERGEHFDDAREYKAYRAALERDPEFLVIQNGSKRFENSRQLVELGLMREPFDFMAKTTDSLLQPGPSQVPEFAEEATVYLEPDFSGKQLREFNYFDDEWKAQIGQMSNFIRHGASVLDLGCGPMWLKDIRPDLQYTGVDSCRRSDNSLVADFNKGEFPVTKSSYAFLSGVLEYVQDVPGFVERICTTSEACILSYCLRGTHPDISARRQWGWVNDLTMNEIENLFSAHSFLLVAEDMTASRNKILVFARDAAKDQRLPPPVPSQEDAFPTSELERNSQRKWVLGHLNKWGVGAELGVFRGHFSQLLARTALPKKLYLVDLWTKQGELFDLGEIPYTNYNKLTTRQAMEDAMRRMAPFKSVFDIEFREETSLEFLDGLAQTGTTLDYAYIDTYHQYDQTLAELHAIDRVLAPHGVIFGDEWHPSKHAVFHGVYRAVQEFCRSMDYHIVACGPALQWCVKRRPKY